jgi:hypothetical protein
LQLYKLVKYAFYAGVKSSERIKENFKDEIPNFEPFYGYEEKYHTPAENTPGVEKKIFIKDYTYEIFELTNGAKKTGDYGCFYVTNISDLDVEELSKEALRLKIYEAIEKEGYNPEECKLVNFEELFCV